MTTLVPWFLSKETIMTKWNPNTGKYEQTGPGTRHVGGPMYGPPMYPTPLYPSPKK